VKQLNFRKAAVQQITTPEQLNELIKVVKPHNWIILYTVLFFMIALILWSLLGSIPTRVKGQGILITENGELYDAIAPEGEARVISINIKIGDHVKKDDVIAHLSVPMVTKQIVVHQKYLERISTQYNTLLTQSARLISERQVATQNVLDNLQTDIDETKKQLAILSDLVEREQTMQKKGYVTLEQTTATLNQVYNVKQHFRETQNKIVESTISLENYKQDWQRRLDELDLNIAEAKRDLSKMIQQQNVSKVVISPVAGVVTSIRVAIGDGVKGGKPIASIASEGKGLDALIYLPSSEGQRVKVGDKAIVSPSIIEKEENGSLVGKVYSVSMFPLSIDSLIADLHNEELAKRFTEDNKTNTLIIPVALKVHILANKDTYSGYEWTSGKGPNQKIIPGMIVSAEITVREQAPISLIIPGLKRLIYEEPSQNDKF
jgi:HlyD family secretion protein